MPPAYVGDPELPKGVPKEQKTNMHHARTIHRQCLDGCPSYDRFAKGASAIVTPAEMLVPALPSRVKQSYAPACLRVPRR